MPNLREHLIGTRRTTERLRETLTAEDCNLQAAPFVSPVKWHLAHTTWFFDNFVLREHETDYRAFHPSFNFLFNSYYESVGAFHARPQRGLLSRPSLDVVLDYRRDTTERTAALLVSKPELAPLVTLGIHHEQQHQELVLMDTKYNLSFNPLRPVFRDADHDAKLEAPAVKWRSHDGGEARIGFDDAASFAFDNERPRHRVYLEPYRIGSRLVTNGEYLDFMHDGGYANPALWLSDGWATAKTEAWNAPLYWEARDGAWQVFTLAGMRAVDRAAPVSHVSYYEADAFARWAGKRLPTEAEWEHAEIPRTQRVDLMTAECFEPGDVWEWTASQYSPYPGFRTLPGSLGEYNGKFMCNQFVLRGGACVTPASHLRATYRNFFPPESRWMFSGIRLAEDIR